MFYVVPVLPLLGLDAMKAALDLERKVNQSLLDLHKTADKHSDYQVRKWHVVMSEIGCKRFLSGWSTHACF